MGNKLFVGNLSWDTTDASLAEFFAQAGEVLEAKIIMDRMTGKSRGFGFVTMADAESAEKAKAELNGKELDGREIKVDSAREARSE
ncbi:MAG: RNA-binding protein [Patescibacteria group bacterium]|nr:RNA-binding protein [Patescibacteria group bacterium]